MFDWDLELTGAARAETPKARERDTIISKERIGNLKRACIVMWRERNVRLTHSWVFYNIRG